MKVIYIWKRIMIIFIDACIINASYLAAFYLLSLSPKDYNHFIINGIIITVIHGISFYFFRLYKSLWTYASVDEFLLTIGACVSAGLLSYLYVFSFNTGISYAVCLLAAVFDILGILSFRFSFRIYRRLLSSIGIPGKALNKRVLVIGAGSAGIGIVNEMKNHHEMNYLPVGLIDDNRQKIGKIISGVKVLGNRHQIESIVEDKCIDEIIIAIPTIENESRKQLINICHSTGRKIKILPPIHELISKEKTLYQVRDVDVADLLGREPITLNSEGIFEYLKDKVVLVTGGGGSIGSELCRQIIDFEPKALLILDYYENNAYDIYNEIKIKHSSAPLKAIIGSVADRQRMEDVFLEYRPEVIFHAAAHKHVPLMEDNPTEAIKNNVFGTLNVVECASMIRAKRFVMISTDKAVNPTNIMGASKRICEMIIQMMSKSSPTEFVAVRFGNVLGSNGSVIPLFKKQIAHGGPVTVTDKNITRYFMTIKEAVQLVLQAGAFARGGEIFVLDMGKPMRIYDLACELIKLSGYELHRDIEIKITGLRPGEKLYEELLMSEEGLTKTAHNKIYIGKPIDIDIDLFRMGLFELKLILEGRNREELYKKVETLVPTYKRQSSTDYSLNTDCNIQVISSIM